MRTHSPRPSRIPLVALAVTGAQLAATLVSCSDDNAADLFDSDSAANSNEDGAGVGATASGDGDSTSGDGTSSASGASSGAASSTGDDGDSSSNDPSGSSPASEDDMSNDGSGSVDDDEEDGASMNGENGSSSTDSGEDDETSVDDDDMNAAQRDAGDEDQSDTGASSDAGDAGEPDAGEPDAGPGEMNEPDETNEPDDVDSSDCGQGEQYYYPGCAEPAEDLDEGCYQACSGDDDDSCPAGTSCSIATINPCVCDDAEPGTGCCAACGQEMWLCQADDANVPSSQACIDAHTDSLVLGGTNGFGSCVGECRFELSLILNQSTQCGVASLVVSDNGGLEPSRVNTGRLTGLGQSQARTIGASLVGVELAEVYGCPDCADGGATQIVLERAGVKSSHTYEYFYPPEVFEDADALLQSILGALRDCEASAHVIPDDDCEL